jgi:hypothetical protein
MLLVEMVPNVIGTIHGRTYVRNGRSEAEHEGAYGGIVLELEGLLCFLNLLRDSVARRG